MTAPQDLSDSRNALLFVGDSDIARWPTDLMPQLRNAAPPTVIGQSAATLHEIVPHVEPALERFDDTVLETIVLVACAGENDIGCGLSLDDTLSAFDELLGVFFGDGDGITNRRLIFLGPKLEPWLDDDPSSRKQYVKLSRAFKRVCSEHERTDEIRFVDCLTMFCGESANVPGATFGGKAKAEPIYFVNDQLHLSEEGYRIWQQVVESYLSDMF